MGERVMGRMGATMFHFANQKSAIVNRLITFLPLSVSSVPPRFSLFETPRHRGNREKTMSNACNLTPLTLRYTTRKLFSCHRKSCSRN